MLYSRQYLFVGDVGVGKTTLLMHIMARVILPLDCGGKDGMVLFLLTDHNFDLTKFIAVIEKYIRAYFL